MKEENCLNPNCPNPASLRGLCTGCYTVACRLVKNRQTSWDKLEKSGRAKPSKKHDGAQRVNWFLSAK